MGPRLSPGRLAAGETLGGQLRGIGSLSRRAPEQLADDILVESM